MVDVSLHQRLVNVWTRLEGLLSGRYREFSPPATEDRIIDFETETNVNLPADYRLSLMIHESVDGLWGSITLNDLVTIKRFWRDSMETVSDYRYIGDELLPSASNSVYPLR